MALFLETSQQRPNRLEDKKNQDYHVKFGRWCLQTINNTNYKRFVTKTLVNWSFYKGGDGQWIFEEDLEAFFLDESGDVRNRLKMTENIIRPMVNQYVGNAIRLSYNAKAQATSDFAINAREKELERLKFFEQMAEQVPDFDAVIRDRIPLGDSPIETEEIFENSWIDTHEEDINFLLEFVSKEIDMEELKVQLTRHLAISGLGVYKGYEQNGRYMGEALDPLFFFWDMTAKKPDLSDSEYMGDWYYMDTPSLFEKYQNISNDDRLRLEKHSTNGSLDIHKIINNYYTASTSKIPVYEVYWKDSEVHEYAWVLDPYKYAYYTRINHSTSDYTDKDIIDPPTPAHKDKLKGKKKSKIYVDVLRYCIFIPKEEIGGTTGQDIVLEFGELEYQEKQAIDPSNVSFPYKCYTWTYDKGEVLSPLDDAINPQRFINRLKSVAESQINNARGSGTVIAKDAVDPRDGEESIMRNVNKSKPIFVDTTRTGSVQNSVGQYGTNIGQGTLNLFTIMKETMEGVQMTTGINDAMNGTQGGSDQLVGVLESQIQRGSIVQEPFYWALTSILKQAHQHIASVGKRIYADNPRRLSIATGDRGMQNIMLTKDTVLEEFKIFIERSEGEKSAIQAGNQLLFTLVQSGLIDQFRFANLFNRADPDMIAKSMREFQAEKAQAAANQSKMEGQQMQVMQQEAAQQEEAAANDQQMMIDNENMNKELDREHSNEQTMFKETAKNAREQQKLNQQL
jgi:hypothetical protein